MIEIQQHLADRYRALHDSRTGPVFFIEHGLAESEVEDLIAEVRSVVEMNPIDGGWWERHRLPLLVVATEVGYRYRGSGTDFWPVLEEELNSQIGGNARQRIRDLFATAATTYRGANPPATPWAEAFHLIAWPITHALVPIEFHRHLAHTLANLRDNVAGLDNETLYRAIRIAAANSSARFSTLLEDPSLIVPVARSLLGEKIDELCPEIVERITHDLASDHVARRSIASANRVQRTASKDRRIDTKQPQSIQSTKGTFQLRRRDDVLTLEVSFPRLDEQVGSRLRMALRRRRYAPKLWGVTARVPSEQLLSGLPFALKFISSPIPDAPLLPGVEELEIDQDLREILTAFDLQFTPPLVFAVGADQEVARLVRGSNIPGHLMYWVLMATKSSLSGLPNLGEVGPYTCYAFDPLDKAAREALADLGLVVRLGVSVAFAGAPVLSRDDSTPAFTTGDQRVVVPCRAYPEGLCVELDGCTALVRDDEVVGLVVSQGDHLLRVSSETETREFQYKGISRPSLSSFVACNIAGRSTEMTVQALLNGKLTFSVESFAPLEGLDLTVEIEVAGRRISASALLGPLPQTISSEFEPFATLLDDATRKVLIQAQSIAVHLRIASLCARTWVLEHRVQPCWWKRKPDGHVVLMSEMGELPFGEVAAIQPHLPPVSELSASPLEARLLAPVGLDTSEYGGAALFSTLCVSPSRVSLEAPTMRKPRLVRRRCAKGGAIGLEDLIASYFRWSLAESDTLIAEMRRRQVANVLDAWTAELCCGEAWARHESELSGGDPWELLVGICNETGLGRDSYIQLSREDELEIARLAVEEIRQVQPELWTRFGPPSDLSPEEYEELDLACGRAYSQLANQYLQRGNEEKAAELAEGDPGDAAEDWEVAMERVKAQVELRPLVALLLPSDTALRLMSLDPSVMAFDELVEELTGWAYVARRAFAGGTPAMDTLKAILALWVEPEVAIGLDWRGAIDTMIAERSVSRAARYLALRCRQAKKGGVAR